MPFKCFSIFSSGGLFVQLRGPILAIFGRGSSVQRFLYFLALAAILFSGVEPF